MRTSFARLMALALPIVFVVPGAAQPGQLYNYTINTAVGAFPYGNGVPARAALLTFPFHASVANGAVYIADSYNHMVRKVSGGQITIVAGTGQPGYSGDGGAATSAQLYYPSAVVADSSGNVYIYDTANSIIRKVDTNGNISTFAGTPDTAGTSGDGGLATQAQLTLHLGGGLVLDSSGNVYISVACSVRKVTVSTGNISTVAGVAGSCGNAGDGQTATSAELNNPGGLSFDSAGDLYIADTYNGAIRMVSATSQTLSTVAGSLGKNGFGGNGGSATAALLSYPFDVAVDSQGNIYIADTNNGLIRKVTVPATGSSPPVGFAGAELIPHATSGTISTLAGTGGFGFSGDGGAPTAAVLANPYGVAVDQSGTVYIADTFNGRIRTISGGTIGEYAGADHLQGDGGKASAAVLFYPQHLAWDTQGNLYIADTDNDAVRKITPAGIVSTVAGNGSVSPYPLVPGSATSSAVLKPQAVTVDPSGNLYIIGANQVLMVNSSGNISAVVNQSGKAGFSGDGGSATAATLNTPQGLTTDSAGNLYIADTYNHRIRKVSGGTISTVAGSGPVYPPSLGSFGGDGGSATSANLSFPFDVAFDNQGNLLIDDAKNYVIRSVNATTGNISTIAGTPTKHGFGGDLGPATSALLDNPLGIAVDQAGNIYISDGSNDVVRIVDALGVISSIGGDGKLGFSGDGGPAISATLDYPFGIGVDPGGNVWFADVNNNRIRELTPSGPVVPSANSVVNGASFVHGGVVPGGIATIFGSNLTSAKGINEASGLPLANQLVNVSVKFNNTVEAPIFAVDNVNGAQQINIQVPWELAKLAGGNVAMQVTNNGAIGVPVTVPVLAAQPGVFVALHANYQPVTSGNPATGGEVLVTFCTNLGVVSPTIGDGAAGTGKELTVGKTTATIGGNSAPVSYSGLAAGFVGLYQVNVQVPTGLSGSQPLVISVGTASSKAFTITVK